MGIWESLWEERAVWGVVQRQRTLRQRQAPKPEAIIDLDETHKTIVAADKDIRKMTNKHNQFLKELGLPHLPYSKADDDSK